MNLNNKLKGMYFGLVVGDVYGAPYEFEYKEAMKYHEDDYKHGQYSEGGPFNLPKGYYTDDTSMMLCLTDSLIRKKGCDQIDQAKTYLSWYREGAFSSTGTCFDIGNQTRKALEYFEKNKVLLPLIPKNKSSGNGALMRYAPIPVLYYHEQDIHNLSFKTLQQTTVTHDDGECKALGIYFSFIITDVLKEFAYDKVKDEIHTGTQSVLEYHFRKLFNDDYEALGAGYVKDSIYIALESVIDSENFIDAIIKSIDYGEDTDTNAAITGMLAGAVYGFDEIPKHLIEQIKDLELITNLYDSLIELREKINE